MKKITFGLLTSILIAWGANSYITPIGGGGGGGVSSVSVAGLPLSVVNPTTAPEISIAQASGADAGYLASADWTTFNSASTVVAARTAVNTVSTLVLRDGSGNFAAGTITAALTGNASTASALAANPSDCAADTFATAIAASGNLTCAQVSLTAGVSGILPNANTTAASANTASAIVTRDGSGNFSAGTITATLTGNVTGALTGNASTATALAANPSDCAADTFATAIAASGNLTCAQVSLTAGVSGILPVANGGTGAGSITSGAVVLGAGTSAFTAGPAVSSAAVASTIVQLDSSQDASVRRIEDSSGNDVVDVNSHQLVRAGNLFADWSGGNIVLYRGMSVGNTSLSPTVGIATPTSGGSAYNLTLPPANAAGLFVNNGSGVMSISSLTLNVGTGYVQLVNGTHLRSSQTTSPTFVVNANAGTGATCVGARATDMSGEMTLVTTAVSPAAGAQCAITFATAYTTVPVCTFSAANAAAAANLVTSQLYITASTTVATINFGVADVTGSTYVLNYNCIETK